MEESVERRCVISDLKERYLLFVWLHLTCSGKLHGEWQELG